MRGGAAGEAAALVGRGAVLLLTLLVRVSQWTLSPLLGACCRCTPTCSQYAIEALRGHGVWRGLGLAGWRLLRCHPWGGSGYDPVPPARSAGASPGRRRGP